MGSAAAQPNILLIYADDLGYGDLGSYGHPVIETPHLDALASQGVRLTQHYSASGLCSPSRAALLTGRYPYRTGIRSWIPRGSGIYLRDEEITLAELLVDAGYSTALIGKWHLNDDLGAVDRPQPNDQGFGYFYGHNAFQIPTNRNPTNVYRNRTRLPMQEGYTAQLYADEAISWLARRPQAQPFFLMLSMAEPHTTIENPPEQNARYSAYTNGEVVPIPSGEPEPPKEKLVPRGPGEYYANITYMDEQIGRVLSYLEAQGLSERTIVVFASDNGPVTEQWINWWEVNAYGSTAGLKGRKHTLYEGGIRVPAIIRYPSAIEAGSIDSRVSTGADLFVTLARAGGASPPTDRAIDGVDLWGTGAEERLADRAVLWALSEVSELEYAVRVGDWKLLLDGERQPRELYNLAEDPLELFNLIERQPARGARLESAFRRLMRSIDEDATPNG